MDKNVPFYTPIVRRGDNEYYMYQNDDGISGNLAETALKGHLSIPITDKVTQGFFSKENMKKIQKDIKKEIHKRTKGKFKVLVDQDEGELLIAMRGIFMDYSYFLPYNIEEQIETLNKTLINFIVPDMITQMKQEYGYRRDFEQPYRLIPRPINSSGGGRNTLPSITTIWK